MLGCVYVFIQSAVDTCEGFQYLMTSISSLRKAFVEGPSISHESNE